MLVAAGGAIGTGCTGTIVHRLATSDPRGAIFAGTLVAMFIRCTRAIVSTRTTIADVLPYIPAHEALEAQGAQADSSVVKQLASCTV